MSIFLSFDPITLKCIGTVDSEQLGVEEIPENYIKVSDAVYEVFSQHPDWIWNGEKPVPPSEAPPLTQLQIDLIYEQEVKTFKLRKQAEEIYIEYGKFIVMFEHMVDALKNSIMLCIGINSGVRHDVIEILLNGFKLNNYTDKLFALYCLIYPDDEDGKQLVDKLLKKVVSLNTERNKVVHGLWFIGFCGPEDTDFSEAWRTKSKVNKGALQKITERQTAEHLKALFKETAKLHGLIGRLGWCMMEPSPGKTQRNVTHEMIDSGEGFRSMYHPNAPIWDNP